MVLRGTDEQTAAKPSAGTASLKKQEMVGRASWKEGRMHTKVTVIARMLSAVVLTLLLTAAGASAAQRGRVYVRIGPPAAVAEVRSVSPGPRYVWIPGYQRWSGRAYVWVPGRWAVPPRARAAWVPGRWVHERRGWYFVDGHWRR
jgi:hypothetical protein